MDARDERNDLEFRLASLRRSYKFFKNTMVPDRISAMKKIKAEANQVKTALETIPEYPYLLQLRTQDEDELIRVLKLMIIGVVKFFHTTDVMNGDQIEESAILIAYQFAGFTLEDVALCFHQAQRGFYGKVYNRVDGAVLMEWLHDYEGRLQAMGMERNRRIHNNEKSGINKNGHDYRIIQPRRLKELM